MANLEDNELLCHNNMIRVIGLNPIVNKKGGQVDLCLSHQKIFNLYVVGEQMTWKSHSYLIVCLMKRPSNDSLIPLMSP